MKPAERTVMVKGVREAATELIGHWPLLHLRIDEGGILRGIYFERSSDPDGFYVWAFGQPLYVLADSIVLSCGDRLGGPSKLWYPGEVTLLTKAVAEVGMPFLRSISTPQQFARRSDGDDLNSLEAKGCSLVASGDYIEGIRVLRQIPPLVQRETPWMCEVEKRTQALADAAERAPEQSTAMLAGWSVSTRRALDL
jgi:hypothetical protein